MKPRKSWCPRIRPTRRRHPLESSKREPPFQTEIPEIPPWGHYYPSTNHQSILEHLAFPCQPKPRVRGPFIAPPPPAPQFLPLKLYQSRPNEDPIEESSTGWHLAIHVTHPRIDIDIDIVWRRLDLPGTYLMPVPDNLVTRLNSI